MSKQYFFALGHIVMAFVYIWMGHVNPAEPKYSVIFWIVIAIFYLHLIFAKLDDILTQLRKSR